MEQKKRHNPPITEEDLAEARGEQAVKAFDRNNDAVPAPLTIDEAVAKAEKEDVKFKKGEKGAKQEFESLIRRVYGVDFSTTSKFDGKVFDTNTAYFAEGYSHRPGFFSKRSVLILPTYTKIQTGRKNENVPLIYAGGQYRPITISVYDPRFWKQSQTFAKAFEYISGQKATLVKEFHEEEVKDEKLEEIVQENETEALEGVKISRETEEIKKEAKRNFRNLLNSLFSNYRLKRTASDWGNGTGNILSYTDREFNVYARKSFLGLKLDVKVARINRTFNWSEPNKSPLTIRVYSPNELTIMAEIAKKYQEKTGQEVELIKKY